MNRSTCIAAATIALLQLACSNEASAPSDIESCTGYPDWQTSAHVLPYAVGAAFRVYQGNCSPAGQGHRGSERYGYDFEMAIGTAVHAARAGRVIHVEVSHSDGEIAPSGFDNYVVVRHADGTHGLYGHLTRAGAFVAPGDSVAQGMRLGRSGNTGNTANFPHLHFSVHICDPVLMGSVNCPSQAATFRNTEANPNGLQRNRSYLALPL